MTSVSENPSLLEQIIATSNPGNATDAFADLRRQAFTSLRTLGLPAGKSEEYRFTPIVRTIEKNFKEWHAPVMGSPDVDITPYLIPGSDTFVIVTINGNFHPGLSKLTGTNFRCEPLSESQTKILGTQLDFSKDAFAALNTALWSGGLAIETDANTIVDKPILVLNINDARGGSTNIHNRMVVNIGRGSKASLIQRTVHIGDHHAFTTTGEEIAVDSDATFNYTRIQNDPKAIQITLTNIRQLDRSHVNTFTLTTDGKLIRNNLTISIDGEKCESHFHGLYLLKGDTLADNHTVVDHRKPNSFSNELYKGVMDDNSKGVFNGKIYVRPDAQKTNAFQSNRNILLTDKSTINTKPQLEIWADDVKCSHGCTTGQLDEEAMFYLQSRGITKEFARAMLLSAFAGETLELIIDPSLKNYLQSIVALRLNGSQS
jgi:Fe-S cluster assembly protein SufD